MRLNRYLDHAVLQPELTDLEAKKAIEAGVACAVKSVCVRPRDIELALCICAGTDTLVGCVLDFPHGTASAVAKGALARIYTEAGVAEIDMVMDYAAARSGRWEAAGMGVERVLQAAKPAGVAVKVILETCMLTTPEIQKATMLCASLGADYVKTSTGFAKEGATIEAVQTMLDAAAGKIKVKASGGIRDRATALRYLEMGVERLGVGYGSTSLLLELLET